MPYRPLTPKVVERLRRAVGDDNLIVGEELPEEYTHDEMAPVSGWPEVAVFPETTGQVSEVVAIANENLVPVTTRGAGTGLMGGAAPVDGGILLVTSKMDRVVEVDEANMIARVGPGVVLMNFQEEMAARGFLYAPDPGERSATIGGNVMTNAGGMRAVKYGVTRDHIRGLEVVLADGSVVPANLGVNPSLT
ncbi:MAG: FAD-binding oxidoreductase, partial [Bacillota bacterium]